VYSLFAVLVLNEPVHYFKKEGESVVAEIIAAVIVGLVQLLQPIFLAKSKFDDKPGSGAAAWLRK